MSHVAEIDVFIKDLEALDKACQAMGLELVRGQKTYKWYGHSVGDYPLPQGFTEKDLGKCSHAIRIPGNREAYEVGVVERRDGRPGYQLLWDFWAGGHGMVEKMGDQGCHLKKEYATQLAVKHYRRQGYRVTVEEKNGQRLVTATR